MTKPRVYIDSCCLIDLAKHKIGEHLEAGRDQEVDFTKLILEATRDDEVEAYTSTLTVVECLHVNGNIPDELKAMFRSLLTSGQYIRLVAPTPFLAEAARDLKWVDGINIPGRGADYVHVASALEVTCSEFLTCDTKGIHKEKAKIAVKGLKVLRPSATDCLSMERRQRTLAGIPSIGAARKKRGKAKSK